MLDALLVGGVDFLAVGMYHACVVVHDTHNVRCWGRNYSGQIGDYSLNNRNQPSITYYSDLSVITNAVKIAAGLGHTCALLSTGEVACWGLDDYGQLGDGAGSSWTCNGDPCEYFAVVLAFFSSATDITAGYRHSCAVEAGSVYCWGRNDHGQLGVDPAITTDSPIPVLVPGLSGVISVEAGLYHTCVVLSDDTTRCWGRNDQGVLGNNGTVSTHLPQTPISLDPVSNICAMSQTCASIVGGGAYCWGDNAGGQLGDGFTTDQLVPTIVEPMGAP